MFRGAFVDSFTVATPLPLGRAHPELHERSGESSDRDLAPPGAMDGAPDSITGADWSLPQSAPSDDPAQVRHGHNYQPGHRVDDDLGAPADERHGIVNDRAGDHVTNPVIGAGGAAHGGLRGDQSGAWSNPEGFRSGTIYTPVNSTRIMGRFRMWGLLRGVRPQRIETGTSSKPATGIGLATSQFDPVANRGGFGPARPVQRNAVPANTNTVDTIYPHQLDGGIIGSEFSL